MTALTTSLDRLQTRERLCPSFLFKFPIFLFFFLIFFLSLLSRPGWRVEYCAASDAWTSAPTGMREFFNQRRRWIPSTIANILNLLETARFTRRVNSTISYLYIVYQVGGQRYCRSKSTAQSGICT